METKSELAIKLKQVLDSMTQEEFDIAWNEITVLNLKGPKLGDIIDSFEVCRELVSRQTGRYYYNDTETTHESKNKRNELFVDSNGFLHSFNDQPGSITYYSLPNKKKDKLLKFYNHGRKHSLTGPAIIQYGKNNEIIREEYWIDGNLLSKYMWDLRINRGEMLNDL